MAWIPAQYGGRYIAENFVEYEVEYYNNILSPLTATFFFCHFSNPMKNLCDFFISSKSIDFFCDFHDWFLELQEPIREQNSYNDSA